VGVGFSAIDLDDAGGDDVEKVAIVCDENDGSCEVFQDVLQPADRFGVEVVGRLVEEEEIRLAGERPAEGDAAFFSSGEWAGGGIEWRGAEGVGEGEDAGVEIPTICVVEEFEEALELGFGAVAIFVAVYRLDDVSGSKCYVFVDGEFGIEFELLREVAGAYAFAEGYISGISLGLVGEDFQE
jgi:hypothetical protein